MDLWLTYLTRRVCVCVTVTSCLYTQVLIEAVGERAVHECGEGEGVRSWGYLLRSQINRFARCLTRCV